MIYMCVCLFVCVCVCVSTMHNVFLTHLTHYFEIKKTDDWQSNVVKVGGTIHDSKGIYQTAKKKAIDKNLTNCGLNHLSLWHY